MQVISKVKSIHLYIIYLISIVKFRINAEQLSRKTTLKSTDQEITKTKNIKTILFTEIKQNMGLKMIWKAKLKLEMMPQEWTQININSTDIAT